MDPELIKAIAVFAMFVLAALFIASAKGMTSKVEGFIGVNPYYVNEEYKEKMEEIRYSSQISITTGYTMSVLQRIMTTIPFEMPAGVVELVLSREDVCRDFEEDLGEIDLDVQMYDPEVDDYTHYHTRDYSLIDFIGHQLTSDPDYVIEEVDVGDLYRRCASHYGSDYVDACLNLDQYR